MWQFTHQNPIDACELGHGSVTLTVSSGNTVAGA